jgi:chromosome segregation ATPase
LCTCTQTHRSNFSPSRARFDPNSLVGSLFEFVFPSHGRSSGRDISFRVVTKMSATTVESATPTTSSASLTAAPSPSSSSSPSLAVPPYLLTKLAAKIAKLEDDIDAADEAVVDASKATDERVATNARLRFVELQLSSVRAKLRVAELTNADPIVKAALQQEKAALQQEKAALQQEKAALQQQIAESQHEKNLLLDAQLQRSRHSSADVTAGASSGQSRHEEPALRSCHR